MSLLGIHLTLLIGPAVPLPAPPPLLEALDTVEVTHDDEERSGFQCTFRSARDQTSFLDSAVIQSPLVKPGARVILVLTIGVRPQVLFDGLITQQQFNPGQKPGDATFTITGEDVSVALDREEKVVEHPAQPETVIALKILASYPQYGLIPKVIPPPSFEAPVPVERTPVQRATDLGFLREMAARYAYVFFVTPGKVPGVNEAYWGPPPRLGIPQPALSVNLGPDTNVSSISFQNDAADANDVQGVIQDRQTNATLPVRSLPSIRPPLALSPAIANLGLVGKRAYHPGGARSATQAFAEAQAASDATTDVVKVEGELDVGRYGSVLKSRGLVGLRGVGVTYDGLYYVKGVTTTVKKHGVSQKFTLTREGTISSVPVVPV